MKIKLFTAANLHTRAAHGHVARTWRVPNSGALRNSTAGFTIDSLNNGINARAASVLGAGVENTPLRVDVVGGRELVRAAPPLGTHTSSDRR